MYRASTNTTGIDLANSQMDYSYDTFGEKDKLVKNGYRYSDIMNSRNSLYHSMALTIWILSLISLQFLLMQYFIMIRPFVGNTRIETVTFCFLIFAALACAWLIRIFLLSNQYLKINIMLSSFINMALLTYIIIADSYYVLYMIYPVVSLLTGIIFFSSKQLFDEYYIQGEEGWLYLMNNNTKDITFTIFSFTGLMVILNCYIIMPNLQSITRWNIGIIFFDILMLAVFVFSFFTFDSPLGLFRNFVKEDIIRKQVDRIKKDHLKDDDWSSVLSDIQIIYYKKDEYRLTELYESNYRRNVIYYYIVVFSCAFAYTNLVLSIPIRIYDYSMVGLAPDVPEGYYGYLTIFLSIGMFGYLIAIGLAKWKILSKKWWIVISFACILGCSFVLAFWSRISIFFAGIALMQAYELWYFLENHSADLYTKTPHEQLKSTYLPVFFISCAISVCFIEGLNKPDDATDVNYVSYNHFLMAAFCVVGIIFTLLLKKVD
jgi:hypothetical protein